jgi:P pilus assembly chaperone PapD
MTMKAFQRTLLGLAGLVLLTGMPTVASTFRVSPMQLDFTAKSTSTLLTINNDTAREIRFEVTAMKWEQDERGEMKLTPAGDTITFFPKLLTLPGKASRTVRVGTTGAAFGATEGTYRLFVEELPDNSAPAEKGSVAIRTKMGIPIFLRPAQTKASAEIADVSLAGGKLVTRVRNTGTVHMIVDTVKMRGATTSGEGKFEHSLNGWYVLAGGTRVFEQPIQASECSGAQTIAVTVQLQGGTLTKDVPVPAGACAATTASR